MSKQLSRVEGSGKKITIRFPAELHEKIAASAARNHRSINAEILYQLSQAYKSTVTE